MNQNTVHQELGIYFTLVPFSFSMLSMLSSCLGNSSNSFWYEYLFSRTGLRCLLFLDRICSGSALVVFDGMLLVQRFHFLNSQLDFHNNYTESIFYILFWMFSLRFAWIWILIFDSWLSLQFWMMVNNQKEYIGLFVYYVVTFYFIINFARFFLLQPNFKIGISDSRFQFVHLLELFLFIFSSF